MNKHAGKVNGRDLRDRSNQVLFMDLRSFNENIEEIQIDKGKRKKKTVLTDTQIAYITDVFRKWRGIEPDLYQDVPEFCKSATIEDIRARDYSLAPSKYIEFIDHDLDIDFTSEMARIREEMRRVVAAEKKSQRMLEEAFRGLDMKLTKLGLYIEQLDERNVNDFYGEDSVVGLYSEENNPHNEKNTDGAITLEQGINIDKQFITPQRSNSNLLGRKNCSSRNVCLLHPAKQRKCCYSISRWGMIVLFRRFMTFLKSHVPMNFFPNI